jgi:NADH dehydrogenase
MKMRKAQGPGAMTGQASHAVFDMTETQNPSGRLAVVFGGGGFLGRYVVRALAKRGWRVRVASRRPDLTGHLQPLGRVGQIQSVQANLRYPASVTAAVQGAEAVINLVGILTQGGSQRFEAVHDLGAGIIAREAKAAGAQALVHVSAIGADARSPSLYSRTKAAGEAAVRENFPQAVIVRPSIVFGPEDDFFNRFAAMARVSPMLPLIGGGGTRFQPVYVGDVAEAIVRAVEDASKAGRTFELGGPEVKTFRQLMEYICEQTGRRKILAPIPYQLANVIATGSEIASKISLRLMPAMMLITRDQVRSLQSDNVVSQEALAEGRTLAALGIEPEALETIVPTYLYRYRKTGQFGRNTPGPSPRP